MIREETPLEAFTRYLSQSGAKLTADQLALCAEDLRDLHAEDFADLRPTTTTTPQETPHHATHTWILPICLTP